MSMRFAVLGSGSRGNSTLLMCSDGAKRRCALIDAGFSPRETVRRLDVLGVRLTEVRDIIITHLDRDHLHSGWGKACARFNIRMHVSRRHYRRLTWHRGLLPALVPFDDDFAVHEEQTVVRPVHLAHDALGSVGFVIEHEDERLGFATDLGRVPDHLYDAFADITFLAIESNYDRSLQLQSDRPGFLKARIMGGAGHLSNHQSFQAVCRIAATAPLKQVVMLHLSQECNRPDLVESLYRCRARQLLGALTISSQFRPTPLLDGARPGVCFDGRVERQGLLFA